MRRITPHVLILVLFLTVFLALVPWAITRAATPPHFWSQRFGDSSDQQHGYAVATDAFGNVFVAGGLAGTIDFGGGPLSSTGPFDIDVFLVKFSPTGVHLWSKRFGEDAQPQIVNSLAIDGFGYVVITGTFRGSVNFGGGILTSAGGPFALDVFVARFDGSGNHSWSKQFGDGSDQVANDVTTDSSGNVLITGVFDGSVDFGGGNHASLGGYDIFVAKLDPWSGTYQWSRAFGDVSYQYAYSVSTDASSNVILGGNIEGTVDFGGGPLAGFGGSDVFLAKLDAAGNHVWSDRYGDASTYASGTAATDASGNVVVTGSVQGAIDFGGGTLPTAGQSDIFLAKISSGGFHLWSKRFGDTEWQNGTAVATDASDNVIVTGSLNGTADFGGGNLTGSGDIFLAKFNSAGAHQARQRYGDSLAQFANAVATDGNGNIVMTGDFQSTVDFGGGDLSAFGTYPIDIFVVKFGGSPGEPDITSIVDIGNDQGRKVKIRFDGSGGDNAQASNRVVRYDAFRRDDPTPSSNAPTQRQPLADGWTQVGSVSAYGEATYGIDVPTDADSTIADGQYYSVFFVRAATGVTTSFFDSPPDSGYSVDNLAPGIPTSFVYNSGVLNWNPSKAEDFDYFSVYGSNTSTFGSATLIDYTVDPTLTVVSSPYSFYFVTATDFAGNEGEPATVNTLSDVGTPRSYILSVSAYPNPFNPATTIRYTVPSQGRVEIGIYDLRGAHVVTLVNEESDAGEYTKEWDARDADGEAVGSGVYFARVTHASGTKAYKLVLLK